MPWTMAAFTVGALSMVGLPPMAGFFSKWYLARGAISSASWSGWVFLVVILLSSLLNAVYFFRIIEKVYMKPLTASKNSHDGHNEHNEHDHHDHHAARHEAEIEVPRDEVSGSMLIPTLVMALGLIVLGLLNVFIVDGIIKFIVPAAGM